MATDTFQREKNGLVVVSVVENRSREVCLAQIDTTNVSLLEIHIVIDNHSYSQTLTLLEIIQPDEILLHDGCRRKILSLKIIEEFTKTTDACRVLFISRQYFDQNRGADMLKKVVAGDVDADMIAKYTVLAGVYCLLRYVENTSGSTFGHHSLRLVYGSGGRDRMIIDSKTSLNLEIISNVCSGNQKDSLFGCTNFTKSVVGQRLLRATLLRPLTDIATINCRLDVVQVLMSHQDVHGDIQYMISRFPDLDKMLNGLCAVPKTHTAKTARIGIDTLIYLKHSLKLLPEFTSLLRQLYQDSEECNPLLETIANNCSSDTLTTMLKCCAFFIEFPDVLCSMMKSLNDIDRFITDSTTFSKSADQMRHQECFAVKSGTHGLLDVARTSFLQCVEDIYDLAQEYSNQLQINVKAAYSASRGYYLQIPSDIKELPDIFVQAVLNKVTISCTTEEMLSLSDRASESILTALTITNELIQELMDRIRDRISVLFAFVDSIALLDMLSSFAELVLSNASSYTRPVLRASGPLVIDSARHPVVSVIQHSPFVENSTFVDFHQNMHIVTGANGSGKSTFIKQVALLVILGQIGSFVPARNAVIPIRDRILSRIGTEDDMENNLSTFQVEMKEASYILANVTKSSLVIIDELGRGTSNLDGMAIAFAIAEHLQSTSAYILFVTHYPQIISLADMYDNVRNVHLKTTIDTENNRIGYLHQIGNGPCDMRSGYGLVMAESCGIPEDILTQARSYQKQLNRLHPMLLKTSALGEYSQAKYLAQQVVMLKDSSLDDLGLKMYLSNLRNKLSDKDLEIIQRYIEQSDIYEEESIDSQKLTARQPIVCADDFGNIPESACDDIGIDLSSPTRSQDSRVALESAGISCESDGCNDDGNRFPNEDCDTTTYLLEKSGESRSTTLSPHLKTQSVFPTETESQISDSVTTITRGKMSVHIHDECVPYTTPQSITTTASASVTTSSQNTHAVMTFIRNRCKRQSPSIKTPTSCIFDESNRISPKQLKFSPPDSDIE